jgi:hypothetical protein
MKILNVRSPYFLQIREEDQVAAQVRLYIWHKNESVPAEPTYRLEKKIPSPTQSEIYFNIAPFIAERINPIDAEIEVGPQVENDDAWVYVYAETYYQLADDKTWYADREFNYVGVTGFTSYMGGYNQLTDTKIHYLTNPDITYYFDEELPQTEIPYYNVLIDHDGESITEVKWENLRTTGITSQEILNASNDADIYMFKIPAKNSDIADHNFGNNVYITTGMFEEELPKVKMIPICEAKYTPVVCEYLNRYGGWQFLTFFKAQTNSLQTENSTFHLLPDELDYNPLRNQFQSFNFSGKQSVTLNTGWVDENYANLISDLMLSETVLLDNKPVNVKTKSTALKTRLKDKNINYTVEFEYSYNIINDVI